MRGWGDATPCLLALLMISVSAAPFFVAPRMFLEEYESLATFSIDAWDSANFSDVAVPQGFDQTSYMDYRDVGVLINNKSEASRTIGWAFVLARNIPLNHVLLWDADGTPSGETINRNQFDDYFADPFREWISNNSLESELNFLVTSKGVPLRVSGGNSKVSFDNEIALVGGVYDSYIGQDYWAIAEYGPFANNGAGKMEVFSRQKHGFFLVTRLTGYTVETALGLIEAANNSLGNRGQFILDLATNRNDSGYKFWNDDLYTANATLNGTMGLPVFFNQNATFITNQSEVIGYASWGSNDGSWNTNQLPNAGFDTADSSWMSGARYWNSTSPPLSTGEDFSWARQTAVKRNGNAALEGQLIQSQDACSSGLASMTTGVWAEYFDNSGISFNSSTMPDLSGRDADYTRIESAIDYPTATTVWSGLDSARFSDDFSARYSAVIEIPETGNWTFYLGSDDGSTFDLEGVRIIDNQGIHPYQEVSNSTNLSAGRYQFVVEVFEQGGWAGIGLSWSGPNTSKQIIPANSFTLASTTPTAEDSLFNHWRFDDAGGSNIEDLLNGDNLTLFGGGGTSGQNWSGGIEAGAYRFNGIDEYAKVEVDDWGGNFSLSLWVYTDNASQDLNSSVFAVNDMAGDASSFQIMADGNGDWQLSHDSTYSFGSIDAGEWTHLAITYNSSNILKLYKNGDFVLSVNLSNDTIDGIDLYKIGVNRAGNTFFAGKIEELKIWNTTLSSHDVRAAKNEVAWICPQYTGIGISPTVVEQDIDFDDELKGHVWNVWSWAKRDGWVNAVWGIQVEAYDQNGTLLSTNYSTSQAVTTAWAQDYMRFRPHENATMLKIRLYADFTNVSHNGSIYFDTMTLRAIRPHMDWVDGSIVETAVSTGGRSFNPGTSYGQSLVADILEDGASATKGYVYEPYLSAVCYPSILLANYAQGFTMAESYYAANPMVSWMGVVVGDPKMAAYADRLHDVNISAMQTNQSLTVGNNGSIRLIIENLGMGTANGTVEIRERSGNILLATYNLSLAPGDASGSRIVLDATVVPTKSGYVDFVARWHNGSQEYPERITANNEKSLNLLVNDIPTVDDAWCTNSQVERGDGLTCTALASDEVSVTWLLIAWRLQNQSQNLTTQWYWHPAVQLENGNWWTSMDIPRNISLGNLDIAVEAFDNHNTSSGIRIYSNISQVVDAIPKWYGIHVYSVDSEMWLGDSNLPPNPEQGLLRQEQVRLRGCVVDADHNISEEQPNFAASRGVVGAVVFSGEIEPGLYCYNSTWIIPIGGDVDPVSLELWVGGQLFSQRQINIADRKPVVELELRDAEGVLINSSTGANEHLWISYDDLDDPGTSAYGDLVIEWPDRLPITIPINIPENASGVSLEIPPAPAGLSRGLVHITANILGAHSNAVVVSEQWEISVSSPRILSIEICDAEGELAELQPDSQAVTYLHIRSSRPLESVQVILAQGDWSVTATVLDLSSPAWNNSAPQGCEANSSVADNRTEILTYKITVDSRFFGGGAEIIAQIIDIDGLSSSFHLPVSIAHSAPVVTLTGELEYEVGGNVELSAIISDVDGLAGIDCIFIFANNSGAPILTILGSPDASGEIRIEQNAAKFPLDENISVEVTCVDSLGLSAGAELSGSIIVQNPPRSDQVAANVSSTNEGGAGTLLLVGAILMLALIATVVIRAKVNQRNRGRIERAGDEQSKAWEDIGMLTDTGTGAIDEKTNQQPEQDPADLQGQNSQPVQSAQPDQEVPLGLDDPILDSAIISDEPALSAVELQHADQQEKSGENLEAEASFIRDITASEANPSHSVDDIMGELND